MPTNNLFEKLKQLTLMWFIATFCIIIFHKPIKCTTSTINQDDIIILSPDSNASCPMGYFQCNDTLQCVSQRLNCDGSVDCDDASDELNCVNDADAKFWDHLFRKQPYGRHDDIPIGLCYWPMNNFSCPCRGNEILCRNLQLTEIPPNLPYKDVSMLDLTGNKFIHLTDTFLNNLPMTEELVLKLCSITTIDSYAFKKLSAVPVKTLYLDENKIEWLPENLFAKGNYLQTLILSGNRLKVLHDYDFMYLEELLELDLRSNLLDTINAKIFEPLQKLEVLYLNRNHLKNIETGSFPTLKSVHTLSLADNVIRSIERNAFTFPSLKYLFLSGNLLTELKARTFCELNVLQGLHLDNNSLRKFDLHAFDCLGNLTSLLLNDNEFRTLDPRVLQKLNNVEYIYFSWFHLCRAALHVRVCEPHGDGISSTHHLLDNTILRGSVWVMASIATVGNLLVIFGRYFYKTRSNVEHSLYLRHLAVSDFLMGIYLTIMACADMSFRGEYIVHEEYWRHSNLCAFSGFLSTFSCQSSTLLLTLVTWDRLMSVMRPLHARNPARKRIIVRLVILWGVSFALAAAPLFPIEYFGINFYGTNGVCLSVHIHDPYAEGWEYSAVLFIFINTFSLILNYIRTRSVQKKRFLSGNLLTELKARTFCELNVLQGLHLDNNSLRKFDLHAFDCLGNLTSLLLNDNEFRTLDPRVLQKLNNVEYIYFSWFHLCRAALHVRVCEPHGDGISSTHHLLDNTILRGSVWVMASIATVGNLLVIFGRYFYKTRSNVEHSLYLRHLAVSDFLMGIYLTIMACADMSFRGEYIVHEEYWRHSNLCAFSGFLSTFSCQSSTLLLTLVTWDRLMSVMRPLHARNPARKRIIVRLVILWGVSFALAAAPLFPIEYFGINFYGTNGVCLSVHIHDPYAEGWEYSAVLFIFINTFSLIFILTSYIRMLQAIKESGGGIRSTIIGRESVVATRFAIIIATDCACWSPVIVVKILALSGISISPSLYAWLAVLVLPVNSALNPILYTLTTAAFKQQLRRYCQAVPNCSNIFLQRQNTQIGCESAVSTSLGHFGSSKSYKYTSAHRRTSEKGLQCCITSKCANYV